MSRQVGSILEQVLAIAFFVVMGATPLAILVLGILNFVRDAPRRAKIFLQAFGALMIWFFVTFVIVMIFFMTVFEYPAYRSQADQLKSSAIFTVGTLIYAVVSAILVYWTWRQKLRMPGMGVSC